MFNWLVQNKETVNLICNILTSVGTVSAVIVALWLAYQGNKAKLVATTYIGVIMPDNEYYLWLSCINIGKQPIACTEIAFSSNNLFSVKGLRYLFFKFCNDRISLLLYSYKKLLSTQLPKTVNYSERVDLYYSLDALKDEQFKKILGEYKWVAALKLKYLWRVVAVTNIKEFHGKLSAQIIKKIVDFHYS